MRPRVPRIDACPNSMASEIYDRHDWYPRAWLWASDLDPHEKLKVARQRSSR